MSEHSSDLSPALHEFEVERFGAALGSSLSAVLNVDEWASGQHLGELYRLQSTLIAQTLQREQRMHEPIRREYFPRVRELARRSGIEAGPYLVSEEELDDVRYHLLCNGATEACDGTRNLHSSLMLGIVQIGIALVAYEGGCHTWVQRLYHHDVSMDFDDPVAEAIALLEARAERMAGGQLSGAGSDENSAGFMEQGARAVMEYSERAALLHLSQAPWRMGHGNPVPFSALTGTAGELGIALPMIEVLQRLVLEHQRFVFVLSDASDRLLLSLGDKLRANEFMLVWSLAEAFEASGASVRLLASQRGNARVSRALETLLAEVAPQIVVGVYRSSEMAPARVFYAPKEFACEAALVAMADSSLQLLRGFPMLIDLADVVCRNSFDGASFRNSIHHAYAAAGEPTRYLGERETRA